MFYKRMWFIAIVIGLLLTMSAASATLTIKSVDWARTVPYGGASSSVTAYVDNDYLNQPEYNVVATLQLSVPGWYTRTFQTYSVTVPGGARRLAISIPFATEPNWPKGRYQACVSVSNSNANVCSPNGVVVNIKLRGGANKRPSI